MSPCSGRSDRSAKALLATLSHELRAPLQAISNWIGLLKSQKLDADSVTQALSAIESNVETQSRLVDKLLDASHILAGQIQVDRRRLNVTSIVATACSDLSGTAEAKNIQLVTELDRGVEAWGDEERLLQALRSLLSNVIKHAPAGGHVEVRLKNLGDGAGARITISEAGKGSGSVVLRHVVDHLRQADAGHLSGAAGLRLEVAIARRLVELQGGTLTSTSGQGTLFAVTLPGTTPANTA